MRKFSIPGFNKQFIYISEIIWKSCIGPDAAIKILIHQGTASKATKNCKISYFLWKTYIFLTHL